MKKQVWLHIYRLIKPHRNKFLLAVFITLLSTGANLIEPLIYREAINDIAGLFVEQAKQDVKNEFSASPGQRPTGKHHTRRPHTKTQVAGRTPEEAIQTLLWAVLILFVVNVLGYVLWFVGDNMNVRLSCLIEQRFIKGAFAHVLRLPLGFFSKHSAAAIAKQIDQSEQVADITNALAQQILPEIISLSGILAIMFWQNPELTLVSVAVIPVYIFIAWLSSQKLETGLDAYYERWEEVSGRITGALTGIKTVKLSGAESAEINHYQQLSGEAYRNYVNRALLSNKFAFWQGILTHISTALVLGFGGYLALSHKITPGDVVMFVAYLDRLYSPIDKLASLWVTVQQNVASISRAFRLLDNKTGEKPGKRVSIQHGLVEFRNVRFGYAPGRAILKGLNLKFEPGKITAIVGTSGAGKTTTVDLLLKLYEPQGGEILIDGNRLSDMDPADIRAQIGLVAADGAIFSGTLADNIRYKKPGATREETLEAAEQAGLKNTIARLPEGMDTPVGQNGMGLSVGERQRINIARVLLGKTKILVLDEATSNLDHNTEAEVKKAVDLLRPHSTVIIISHRFSMVRDADHVYVLGDGEILESGTPAQLIEKGGWLAEFAKSVNEENAGDEMKDES